ncbi:hypothetical protein APHAL10511_006004 [Amanita phalloides]|nr:hypothetical protein APHAL10511_006004 [Amanita phalloides]
MSLLGLPPATHELKSIVPFLQRAHEVRQQHPIIAYWCSYYAAQQGLAIQAKDPSSRQFLFALVDLLERMKKDLASSDAIDNEAAGCAYVENFALRVFSLADNEDREGKATRATARKFLAAANFLEVLTVFPKTEISDSTDEKIRYAKWKAAEIAKAFREGRTPIPGPAAAPLTTEEPPATGNLETAVKTDIAATHEPAIPPPFVESETSRAPRSTWVSGELEGLPSPVSVTPPPVPQRPLNAGVIPTVPSFNPDVNPDWNTAPAQSFTEDVDQPWFPQPPPLVPSAPPYVPPDAGPRSPPVPSAPPTIPNPVPVPVPAPRPLEELAPSLVVKIQKHCRYAISALDYEDAEQARRELRAALDLLGG